MRSRILSVMTAGILLFGMSVFAQDSSSASGQSDTTTKSTSSKKMSKSKKDTMGGATSATQSGETSSMAKVPAADKAFMTKAAQGGLAEVQLGQLAQDKASSNDVKEFGKQIVDDHSKANDQLKSIASQKGVTLPTDLSAKDKAEKDRLSKLSGDQFDKAYMRHMVQDHTKDVSEFKKESSMAKDNDVKNFASQTLPTLESHLDKAKSVASTVGATSKASAAKSKSTKTSASTSQPQ